MIVIISGLTGSGKTTICKYLIEKLNLEYISGHEILEEIIKEKNIPKDKILEHMEKDKNIDLEVDKRILNKIKENCVVDSRTMPFLFKGNAIKIFLYVDKEERIKRVAKRENISLEESRIYVEKKDYSDIKRYLEIYGCDFTNPKYYDIIVNITNLDTDKSCNLVYELIKTFAKFK
jgi:cytidylate kinase